MSYFPILSAPYCYGKTTLFNFAPNNWQSQDKCQKFISLTYIEDGLWHSRTIGKIDYHTFKVISHSDVVNIIPDGAMALLSLSKNELPETSIELPMLDSIRTSMPNSRATLGLKSEFAQTSYQGEIDPFPAQASLLTFSPFLQFGDDIENYVLLMNLEKKPENRQVEVEIYETSNKQIKKVQSVFSNKINIISLDDMGFDNNSLPAIICRGMASIPLYFSSYKKGVLLSLEHTHPPASLVLHGNRFGIQKMLKEFWFSKLKNNETK